MTGLIFGSIIAAWAAVLVPMWLRRHDERNEARSVERFSSAMRVLGRRGGASAKLRTRSVVMPARPESADVHVTSNPAQPRRAARPVPRPSARASLARRRRRTLLALVLLVLVTTALAAVGITAAVWALVPAAMLLVGFLVHLRVQARVAQQAAWRRAATVRRSAAREERRRTADRLRPAARSVAEAGAAALAGDAAPEEQAWDPREVPLPTYVTKPFAPRMSESPLVRHPAPAPEDDTDEALDDELGLLLERRRVVGE